MKPIQFILLPLFGLLMVLLFQRLKRHKLLRVLVLLLLAAGMVFVAFEDSSTYLANLLGIGRGVDLVLYLGLLGLGLACLFLYLRTQKLERMLTELVREQAIREGQE